MKFSLRQRTLGLVGLVLLLSAVVLGITFLAIHALEKERAAHEVQELFLKADRHRQAFLQTRDMFYATQADEALVAADSIFRAALTSYPRGATGMRDSIDAFRGLTFRLANTNYEESLYVLGMAASIK